MPRPRKDLQAMMPYIKGEIEKGRDKTSVFRELKLSPQEVANINYYLRRELPPEAEETEEDYLIREERPHKPEYVMYKGVRYRDITRNFIDCGG